MLHKSLLALGGAALAATSVTGCTRAIAQESATATPSRDVELTIYKQDFGVVREARPVSLKNGTSQIGFTNVSKTLDQDSVIFDWPGEAKGEVVSTTYELGVNDSNHLLKRYVGQQVELVRYGDNGEEAERETGILQVADPGNLVLLIDGKYVINPPGTIIAPGAGIVTIPQLSASVSSNSDATTQLGVTYLTRGLSWNADYVATLSPTSDDLALECWATVVNQTGVDFPSAKISFVAGSPNRAVRQELGKMFELDGEARNRALDYPMETKQVAGVALPSTFSRPTGESYSYPLKERATIKQDQVNRVKMLDSESLREARLQHRAARCLRLVREPGGAAEECNPVFLPTE